MVLADRAKAIKTTATVNESPTDKLIRELREENARLMEMLKTGGVVMPAAGGVSNDGRHSFYCFLLLLFISCFNALHAG